MRELAVGTFLSQQRNAIAVAKRMNGLLRRKTSEGLTQILDAAAGTSLRDFAASLRRDLTAIQAALDLPWTTSPVEGQINRLKMLKRTMVRPRWLPTSPFTRPPRRVAQRQHAKCGRAQLSKPIDSRDCGDAVLGAVGLGTDHHAQGLRMADLGRDADRPRSPRRLTRATIIPPVTTRQAISTTLATAPEAVFDMLSVGARNHRRSCSPTEPDPARMG